MGFRVGNAEKNDISFVTLNILKVFHEEIVLSTAVKKWLYAWIGSATLLKLILNCRLLPHIESSHGEGSFRISLYLVNNCVCHSPGLNHVQSLSFVNTIGDVFKM